MKIHLKGGRLIDPGSEPGRGVEQQADVFVADGLIVALGAAPADFTADRTVDVSGLVVAPGLVDLAARLREPAHGYKATLESEMSAALAGGVTSLVCPPDTVPVLDEPGLVEMLKSLACRLDGPRVYPLGALTVGLKGSCLTEMVQLTQAGCIGFSQANVPILDTQVLLCALQYATTYGYTVWLRAQDFYLSRGGVAASGPVASRLGLAGVPTSAETIALHTILELVRATGARVHLPRLSSASGLTLVRAAKQEGLPVTCDVTINHLHLIDIDIGYFDAQYRLDPPLRAQRDRDAIRAGLADGTIDAICSDHTPVDDDEKMLPFGEATPGASGLELLLSLTIKWAQDARVPLGHALAKVTCGPAAVLGLECGRMEIGAPADLCVFDPQAYWSVEASALRSQGHNTPFLGYEVPARVRATLVAGRVAFEQADNTNF
ncbi:dihydroorotase [Burkholderia sp. L27(2015)]|uniref:dihydroorotase n=1 Tax=Burkholderia sp. L27(2015) TaxID=1641858 RepID=UPI00131D1700|nr:dihydroorotase [Burkholderia sp. L27(2015)]